MKTYCVIITTHQAIDVQAETEEQAIEAVRQRMNPRDAMAAEFQIAHEVILEEN
jgi:hypothetical protein